MENKKSNGLVVGIIGVILIILSRSGVFKHEVEKTSGGMTFRGFIEENKMITYPLLIIGIILVIYAAIQYNKSKKNNY